MSRPMKLFAMCCRPGKKMVLLGREWHKAKEREGPSPAGHADPSAREMRRTSRRGRSAGPRVSRGSVHPGIAKGRGQLVARADPELAEGAAQVELHGPSAEEELRGDLGVAATGRGQLADPALARGQR